MVLPSSRVFQNYPIQDVQLLSHSQHCYFRKIMQINTFSAFVSNVYFSLFINYTHLQLNDFAMLFSCNV